MHVDVDEQAAAAGAVRSDAKPRVNLYDYALSGVAAAITFLLALHVTANAIGRTFFNNPLHGTLEYTQFWYIPIIAFIGIATAQRNDEHIRADLFFTGFPEAAKPVLQLVIDVVTVLLILALVYYTGQMAVESAEIKRTAGVTDMAMWPATFIAPIGFALFAGALTVKNVSQLRRRRAARVLGTTGEDA